MTKILSLLQGKQKAIGDEELKGFLNFSFLYKNFSGYSLSEMRVADLGENISSIRCNESSISGRFLIDRTDKDTLEDVGTVVVREDGIRLKRQIENDYIDAKWFGVVPNATYDQSLAIKYAINSAVRTGIYRVKFPTGKFRCKNIEIPDDVIIEGSGLLSRTQFERFDENPIFIAKGKSVLNANHDPVRKFQFKNLVIHTRDIDTINPAVWLEVAYEFVFEKVNFFGTGRQLLLWEGFDSVFDRCRFDWGGSSTNPNVIGVELASTDRGLGGESLEYTNNIYFNDCVFEAYVGLAMKSTGSNTSKLFFKNLKMESLNCLGTHLDLSSCVDVHFNELYMGSQNTNDHPIKLSNSANVYGKISFDYFPSVSGTINKEPILLFELRASKLDFFFNNFNSNIVYNLYSLIKVNYAYLGNRDTNDFNVKHNMPVFYRSFSLINNPLRQTPFHYKSPETLQDFIISDNADELYFGGENPKFINATQSVLSIRTKLGLLIYKYDGTGSPNLLATFFQDGSFRVGSSYLNTGEKLQVAGNAKIEGKVVLNSGSNQPIDSITLTAGTATKSNSQVTTSSKILAIHRSVSGAKGVLDAQAGNGTFTVNSSSNTDNSTIDVFIFN
ncbi:hypothetical protein GOQ04_14745 [Emticicia sp. ODNR4P]|nr:hypothetical protein [Emticicia sp. ODNR4P]